MPDDYPLPLGPFLSTRVAYADGVAIFALAGEFDLPASQPVGELLTEVEATAPRAIVVDLQALTFLDSSGVRVLIDAHSRSQGERAFAVLNGSGPAHRALTMMGGPAADHGLLPRRARPGTLDGGRGERVSRTGFEVGDEAYVERAIPLARGSLISMEPGDAGVVEAVGDHFLALRIHGTRVVVSKADVVRATAPGGSR